MREAATMQWAYLAAAIGFEVAGTLGLRSIAGAVSLWPVCVITLAYAASFCFLALALRQLSVGVSYAIWSAVGTAAVAVAGALIFGERVNLGTVVGLVLVVAGVVVLVSAGGAQSR
jgi:small multidrug resistance pump